MSTLVRACDCNWSLRFLWDLNWRQIQTKNRSVCENAVTGISGNRPFYSCVLSDLAMNASEAGGEFVLIETSLLFSCKCQVVSIRTT